MANSKYKYLTPSGYVMCNGGSSRLQQLIEKLTGSIDNQFQEQLHLIYASIELAAYRGGGDYYPLAVTVSSEMSPEGFFDVVLSVVTQNDLCVVTLMKEDFSFYQVVLHVEEPVDIEV